MERPLTQQLRNLAQQAPVRFFMPGHKGRGGSENLLDGVLPYDVTELPDTDDLYQPEGVLALSQRMAARAMKAPQVFYCTNGCTGALHTALQLAARRGRRMLVDRNCHKSVIHGGILLDLEMEFLQPDVLPGFGITAGYTAQQVEKQLAEKEFSAVVLTSPTYYGVVSRLEEIAQACHAHGALLVVDAAHGSHFPFHPALPAPPWLCGADLTAVSNHKTQPVLTQAACLVTSEAFDPEEVRRAMSLTCSSSPSYLLMASLEQGVAQMAEEGQQRLEILMEECARVRKAVRQQGRLIPLESGPDVCIDPTRLVIQGGSFGGYGLYQRLMEQEIWCEMADTRNVVILPSIHNTGEDFYKLEKALLTAGAEAEPSPDEPVEWMPMARRVMPLRQAWQAPFESVPLEQAEGRICGETKGVYPPGVCVLTPGERIDSSVYRYINDRFTGTIRVIKE
ncbi:MAG: aminotransferase class I/II-fold pyridoxal phosphate-dependent enzyme [Eubacteriales bacterium]|jgi:arginine/lysine/ornithine decarboxylase